MSEVTGLRKAAVLMVQLGRERSAAVLSAMREGEIEEITAEIAKLENIDSATADLVMEEFHDTMLARRYYSRGGLSFAREVLESSLGPEKAREAMARLTASLTEMPFQFLHRADPRHLLSFLQDEHPQTIALVLSYMGAEQAAIILGSLNPTLQSDVAHRIAVMERTSPESVRVVEEVFEKKLSSVLVQSGESSKVGGLKPLVDIINRSDRTTERLILESLEERNPELAELVRSQMFMFEDIVNLDDKAVQLVLRQVEVADLATALKGVRDEVKRKVLTNMSERASQNLEEEIELLGPVRLKTVEEAQAKVVHEIRQLDEAGQIIIQRGSEDEFVD
jgi:flagellar motor switch protein FliG